MDSRKLKQNKSHASVGFRAGIPLTKRKQARVLFVAMLGLLSLGSVSYVYAAPDECQNSASVALCTGDQSNGVLSGRDFPYLFNTFSIDTLYVFELSQPIEVNTNGIAFIRAAGNVGDVTVGVGINSGVEINTTGDQSRGILAKSESNGGNVTVQTQTIVTIDTQGNSAHGIDVSSEGGYGADGDDACTADIFDWCNRSSTRGAQGGDGGTVNVDANGNITTVGQNAIGVFARSVGGQGGTGGDSSAGRNAKAGGAGGDGGIVRVTGSATIQTTGENAHGIFAVSAGGNGGAGGDSDGCVFGICPTNDAEAGGLSGGGAGALTIANRHEAPGEGVNINGSWTITTAGNSAHAIWGKNSGGVAGPGGGGAWTGTDAGSGGLGMGGGAVEINSAGSLQTSGDDAYGIFGQSIGGYGGIGGDSAAVFSGSGASGGSAGVGGYVEIINSGYIGTGADGDGDRSHAIYAQSIGGGGGSGGSGSGLVGLGGGGSSGGFGGNVKVTNEQTGGIVTNGYSARGIYAQSIGGGGGDGGDSAGLIAFGGSGSGTSDGGKVDVSNAGIMLTFGDRSNAIFAQSIGGGGGDGGSSTGLLSFGGSGGGGGDGDDIHITNTGGIGTYGDDASAIFAQSVGGGGGNGGNSNAVGYGFSFAMGGTGGSGGDAGSIVQIDHAEARSISTEGDRSHGIHAQSVGGGGGNGGYAISAAGGDAGAVSMALGGTGGNGGVGNTVIVNNSGHIITQGNDAHGVFAQSIGGGGGSGGFSIAASASAGSSASVSLGGSGGAGNRGGSVDVISLGDIITGGNHAYGILAQSVGGGGGDGGFSVAGSLGASAAGAFAMGGDGGIGAWAEAVHVDSESKITTYGNDSHALVAQSIGGGGGTGGFSVAGSLSGGYGAAASLGGGGGAGSFGGGVSIGEYSLDNSLHISGDIDTEGDHAYGILAQSVGGGGGDGGFSVAGTLTKGSSAAFSMGGIGGDGGESGKTVTADVNGNVASTADALVEVYSANNIRTLGKDSHAIVAQSIGGGGGSGGFSVAGGLKAGSGGVSGAASLGGNGGAGGHGGKVVVDFIGDGDIETVDIETGVRKSYRDNISIDEVVGVDIAVIEELKANGIQTISGLVAATREELTLIDGIGDIDLNASVQILLDKFATAEFAQLWNDNNPMGSEITIDQLQNFTQQELYDAFGNDFNPSIDELLSQLKLYLFTAPELLQAQAVEQLNNDSHSYGILAQSIGGGGGDGGFSIAGTLGKNSTSATFSLGGSGGTAGDANAVDVTNSGNILTHGENSIGIMAESAGGGGGSGGFSVAGTISLGENSKALNMSIGGDGGGGGEGGAVTVDNEGIVATEGKNAHGVYALSVGGGGGTGGFSATGLITSKPGSKQLALSVGGSGGAGGNASTATVNNSGTIFTEGERANAIYAQSIGGGGGDGGLSFSGSFAGKEAKQMSLSVGGFGGGAGDGSTVDVSNSGQITTLNNFSSGIYAQSVGGGGGNGGMSIASTLGRAGQEKNINIGVSIGGFGGGGGVGGSVNVRNCLPGADASTCNSDPEQEQTASITTLGNDSHGIFAQSVGGGGGNGGTSVALTVSQDPGEKGKSNNIATAIGGVGGVGNLGGVVDVENRAAIDTSGNEAHGIFAQSIGGGGGNGGSARTIALNLGKAKQDNNNQQTGGTNSGDTNAGDTDTGGTNSNSTNTEKKKPKNNTSHELALGGTAGVGGIGGTVNVNNTGSVVTRGADSHAIFAQSIGGGGGTGGNGAHGVPDNLPIPSVAEALLDKALSEKKAKPKKLSIVVGGNAGYGNDGGNVNVDHTGFIRTLNAGAYGVLAQSVGAGGGVGGNGAIGEEGTLSIGGGGGASGNGGDVLVDINGDIETYGLASHAIFAQSIGGGGGVAGDLDYGIIDAKEDNVLNTGLSTPNFNIGQGIAYQRGGGGAGDGGIVTVDSIGTISTFGHAAYGIFAQSVGGGGGLAGDIGFGILNDVTNVATCIVECNGLTGSAGGDGAGGDINITHEGDIFTTGDVSHGIFAQSAGGLADGLFSTKGTPSLDGDGNFVLVSNDVLDDEGNVIREGRDIEIVFEIVQFSGLVDLGGDINISVDGNVAVQGAEAHGIFAQSVGGDGNGDISISLLGDYIVQGGSGEGVGVRFKGGSANSLNNEGTITSVDGVFGEAIFAGDGDETIDNFGTIIGAVNLGNGINRFNNHADATFNAGSNVVLGGATNVGMITNEGTLSPGGRGQAMTTVVTGDLTQTATGRYVAELDVSNYTADLLDIGGTGTFGGTVEFGLIGAGQIQTGTNSILIATAADIVNSGVTLEFAPSAVNDYQLVVDEMTNEEISIVITSNFLPDEGTSTLSDNQKSLSQYVAATQSAGGSAALDPVMSFLISQPDQASLANAYEKLSPGSLLSTSSVNVNSSLRFNEAMLSCRQRDEPHRYNREGNCNWSRVVARTFDRDATSTANGFSENAFEISGGSQRKINGEWFGGWGVSYESSELDLDGNLGSSSGTRLQAGGMFKRSMGDSILTTGLTAGYGSYDTKRNTGLAAPNATATSDQNVGYLAVHARFAHVFDKGDWYIRPMIDGGLNYSSFTSFTEKGAGGANLIVDDHTETYSSVQPAIEFGSEIKWDGGILLRPYAKLGVTHFFSGDVPEISARFEGAPQQVAAFTVEGETDKTFTDLTLGIDILRPNSSVLRFDYAGQFSGNVAGHAVSAKYSWAF